MIQWSVFGRKSPIQLSPIQAMNHSLTAYALFGASARNGSSTTAEYRQLPGVVDAQVLLERLGNRRINFGSPLGSTEWSRRSH